MNKENAKVIAFLFENDGYKLKEFKQLIKDINTFIKLNKNKLK